jgi:hypothetical protein
MGIFYVALGGAIGIAIVLIWVLLISDISSYIQMTFFHSGSYASLGSWRDSIALIANGLKSPLGVLTVLAFAGAMFTRYRVLACVVLVSSLGTVILPRRNFSHYWVGMIPGMAILLVITMDQLKEVNKYLCWITPAFIYVLCQAPICENLTELPGVPHWSDYSDLARVAERYSQGRGTLLVYGDLTSEAINFASSLPRANKYWILWMLEPPSDTLLPINSDQIIADYQEHPPEIIVAEDSLLNRLERPTQPGYESRIKLGHALFSHHDYVLAVKVHNWSIKTLVQPKYASRGLQFSDGN